MGNFLSSLSLSGSDPSVPRHKDPAGIEEEKIPALQFLSLGGVAMEMLSSEKWDSAKAAINKFLLAHIPENLKYVHQRFQQLLQELIRELENGKTHIDKALQLSNQARMQETEEEIDEARMDLVKAERSLNHLDRAAAELARNLGVTPKFFSDRLEKIRELLREYLNSIREFEEKSQKQKELLPTILTISSPDKEVIVGSWFRMEGQLITKGGLVLPQKQVHFYLEDKSLFTVLTRQNGQFGGEYIFPPLYRPEVKVWASYLPEGEDLYYYAPSVSNILTFYPVYDTPVIKARTEEKIYPGFPFTVEGDLTLNDYPLPQYPIHIRAVGYQHSLITDEKGGFITRFTPPKEMLGKTTIRLFTLGKGRIGPSSANLAVTITRRILILKTSFPRMILAGIPFDLRGRIEFDYLLPKNLEVKIKVGKNNYHIFPDAEGNFRLHTSFPFSTLNGWQYAMFSVIPEEAWIAPALERRKMLVINPLIPLPLTVFLVLIVKRSSKRKETYEIIKREEPSITAEEVKSLQEKILPPISRWYKEAVGIVSEFTKKESLPAQTVREYLKEVKPLLGEKYQSFERLSLITEKFLYASGYYEKEMEMAESAFKDIKRIFVRQTEIK